MKLLCLDDDPRLEPPLRRIGARAGYTLRFLTASGAFKREVRAEPPDLVLLDLSLGQESGIDILEWLAGSGVRVPVILFSGHGEALLDTARRIGQTGGVDVRGAFDKANLGRDLPPLLLAQRPPPKAAPSASGDADAPPAAGRPAARQAPEEHAMDPAELARHIEAGRIEPFFQPIVSPIDGRLRGAETLARLRLPSGQILSPRTFVPVAESAGLILPLTEALFERILMLKASIGRWRLELLSVNLSATALDRQRNLALVRALIEGLAGDCRIMVELTETAAMADSPPVRELAAQIRLQGASLALDDFGTGYSSLRALAELPFDTLKVDLSFVFEATDSAKARSLLRAILSLAHNLGLRTIAEGVESEAQRRFLARAGADLVQGFRFGAPMDAETFARRLHGGAGAADDRAP